MSLGPVALLIVAHALAVVLLQGLAARGHAPPRDAPRGVVCPTALEHLSGSWHVMMHGDSGHPHVSPIHGVTRDTVVVTTRGTAGLGDLIVVLISGGAPSGPSPYPCLLTAGGGEGARLGEAGGGPIHLPSTGELVVGVGMGGGASCGAEHVLVGPTEAARLVVLIAAQARPTRRRLRGKSVGGGEACRCHGVHGWIEAVGCRVIHEGRGQVLTLLKTSTLLSLLLVRGD